MENLDEIDKYYKLKKQYQQKINALLFKFKDKYTGSRKRKSINFIQYKSENIRCIHCKKIGGTIFDIKNRTLIARCNAPEKCNLNMNVKIPSYSLIYDLLLESTKEYDLIKLNIIKTKLEYLFNLTKKEKSLENFKKLKVSLDEESEILSYAIYALQNVTDNPDKKKLLNSFNSDLKKFIKEYKNLLHENDIKKAVEIYNNDIVNKLHDIRNLKYETSFVSNNRLIQNEHSIQSLEHIIEDD